MQLFIFFLTKTNKSTSRQRYLYNICVGHPRMPAIARINHVLRTCYPTQQFLCTYYILRDLLPSMTLAGNYNIDRMTCVLAHFIRRSIVIVPVPRHNLPHGRGGREGCSPIVEPNNTQRQIGRFLQG